MAPRCVYAQKMFNELPDDVFAASSKMQLNKAVDVYAVQRTFYFSVIIEPMKCFMYTCLSLFDAIVLCFRRLHVLFAFRLFRFVDLPGPVPQARSAFPGPLLCTVTTKGNRINIVIITNLNIIFTKGRNTIDIYYQNTRGLCTIASANLVQVLRLLLFPKSGAAVILPLWNILYQTTKSLVKIGILVGLTKREGGC